MKLSFVIDEVIIQTLKPMVNFDYQERRCYKEKTKYTQKSEMRQAQKLGQGNW